MTARTGSPIPVEHENRMHPRYQHQGRASGRTALPVAVILTTCLAAAPALGAVVTPAPSGIGEWTAEVFGKIRSPWFWFGMTAQFVFFMRFLVQWIVSEKRQRSTIPLAFWYLSLVGSLALFVYAAHERDPVIMAGQLLACLIYIRNLMLIYGRAARLRRAGLPVDDLGSNTDASVSP